jgi:hypothetical protein
MLAKAGTASSNCVGIGLPVNEMKNLCQEKLRKEWNLEWLRYEGARMAKLFIKGHNKARSKEILKRGCRMVGMLVRALTGHNALNYFCSKIDPEIDPNCRFCEEEQEEFWHLVTECPVFRSTRVSIFCERDPSCGDWDVSKLIDFLNNIDINEAMLGPNDITNGYPLSSSACTRPEPEPD